MRKLIFCVSLLALLILCTISAYHVIEVPEAAARMSVSVVGGGVPVAGCTTPTGHTYDQGFETGFPITDWTTSETAPTSGATLSGTPPAASCSKGMVGPDDTTTRNAYYSHSVELFNQYFRFDFRINSSTISTWNGGPIFSMGKSATWNASSLGNIKIARGGDEVLLLQFSSATDYTLVEGLSTGTWYIITGYIDVSTPANSWIKVNGGSPISIVPYAVSWWLFHLGDVGGMQMIDWEIGYFAFDDAEIL